jgi:50S ribosomal protein L16 3-hydroxylase
LYARTGVSHDWPRPPSFPSAETSAREYDATLARTRAPARSHLVEWLAPASLADFRERIVGRAAYARPGSARESVRLLDWAVLDRVLSAAPAPDVLVVASGKVWDAPVPRSLAALRALMGRGLGLNVHRAQRLDGGLRELSTSFAETLNGEAQIQLFVTPAGTHGFGWHFDDEEVFIVQTAGAKEYFFRKNTTTSANYTHPDFTRIHAETSPLQTARLLPGDWLYVPRRWWHVAECLEHSLSISVGVRPRD